MCLLTRHGCGTKIVFSLLCAVSLFVPVQLRIVFVGPEKVGKTAIINRLRGYGMPFKYNPTMVEDEYSHSMALLLAEAHPVTLVDTTGSCTELGAQTRNESVVFADAIVLVFSMRDPESFNVAMEMLRTVEMTRSGRPCPVLVVGNQSDEANADRETSYDMTNAIFSEIETRRESSEIGFVVVSALENRNITTIEHRLSDIFEPQRHTKRGLRDMLRAVSRSSLHSASSKRSRTSSIFSIEHQRSRSASFSVGVRNKLKRHKISTSSLAPQVPVANERAISCPQIAPDEAALRWHVSPLASPLPGSPPSSQEHSRAPSELEEIMEDEITLEVPKLPHSNALSKSAPSAMPTLSPDSGVHMQSSANSSRDPTISGMEVTFSRHVMIIESSL